jgi:hypothetical protein
VTPVKSNPWRIKEKNLPKHLEGDNEGAKVEAEVNDSDNPGPMDPVSPEPISLYSNNMELAIRDYQLNEALTLLKGLSIANSIKTPRS